MQRTAVVTEPKVGSVVYLDPRGHVHSVDRQMARRLVMSRVRWRRCWTMGTIPPGSSLTVWPLCSHITTA